MAVKIFGTNANICHGAAKSARIHQDGASDRSGNPVKKFGSRKRCIACRRGNRQQRGSRACKNAVFANGDFSPFARKNHNAVKTAIGKNHIAGISNNKIRQFTTGNRLQYRKHLLFGLGKAGKFGIAADAKAAVFGKRTILFKNHAVFCQQIP